MRQRSMAAVVFACVSVLLAVSLRGQEREVRQHDVSGILGGVLATRDPERFTCAPRGNLVFGSDSYTDASAGFAAVSDFHPDATTPRDLLMHALETVVPEAASSGDDGVFDDGFEYVGSTLRGAALPEVHRDVQTALAEIERLATPVRVECVVLPGASLRNVLAEEDSGGPYYSAELLDRATLLPAARHFFAVVASGRRVALGTRDLTSILADREVNSTGVLPVVNPTVERQWDGERLELQALALSDEDGVWIDFTLARSRTQPVSSSLSASMGKVDMPAVDEQLLSTSVVCRRGATLLAGSFGQGGDVCLLRAAPGPRPRAPAGQGSVVRAYNLAALFERADPRIWPSSRTRLRFPALDRRPRYPSFSEIERAVKRSSGDLGDVRHALFDVPGGPESGLLMRAPAAVHAALDRILREEAARRSRMAALDLWLLTVSRQALAELRDHVEDARLLRAGWESSILPKALNRLSLQLSGKLGEVHSIREAKLRFFLGDVEVVSGGTGFSVQEIADPIVSSAGSGFELRFQVDGGGERLQLQLEGGRVETLEWRTVKTRVLQVYGASTVVEVDGKQAAGPTSAAVVEDYELTLPRQRLEPWNARATIPPARDVILKIEPAAGDLINLLIVNARLAE